MSECRLVVFDLFGTTVAEDGSIEGAFRAVLERHGLAFDGDLFVGARGLAKRDALRMIAGDRSGVSVDALYAAFHRDLKTRWAASPLCAAAGAARVFGELEERGVRLAITSGLDRDLVSAVLAAVDLPAARAAIVCAEDVRRGRPAPDMIQRAMTLSGVTTPDAVACVGDTAADLEAAAAAGVRWRIGVLGGAHDEARLRTAPHTSIIAHLDDLPRALGVC